MIIPALTLWQPWASLIEVGAKPYETRGRAPPQRLLGQRIAIHAAARPCVVDFDEEMLDALYDVFGCSWNYSLPRGMIVCAAVLAESLPAEKAPPDLFGDYSPGRWAWRLEDVRPIKPHVPAKGMQLWGWPWTVPAGVMYL